MEQKLNTYLQKWNLLTPKLLAQTPSSHVYTVTHNNEQLVLKLLTAYGWEEANGAIALRYFNGNSAVRVLSYDVNAQLLEYAPGEDLKAMVLRGQDDQASAIIGDVLNGLHAHQKVTPPSELRTLRSWFRALFEKAKQDENNGQKSLYRKAAAIADKLLSHPLNECVLHGDIHHENIRASSRGWLAIDPKGLIGETTYDAANTLFNPTGMDDFIKNEDRLLRVAAIVADKIKVPVQRLVTFTFIHACLSNAWMLEEGQPLNWQALKIAELAEQHILSV